MTFGHPLITSIFSRDRFKQLLRFFRVVAPTDAAAEIKLIEQSGVLLFSFSQDHFITVEKAMLTHEKVSKVLPFMAIQWVNDHLDELPDAVQKHWQHYLRTRTERQWSAARSLSRPSSEERRAPERRGVWSIGAS